VGGVLGGIALLCLICAAVYYFNNTDKAGQDTDADDDEKSPYDTYNSSNSYENPMLTRNN